MPVFNSKFPYPLKYLPDNDNKNRFTDTHIVSVLQIWSPLVIIWLFLLFIAPTYYEKYIRRFRSSTARNIHISLSCLLAYSPLLVLALGTAGNNTSSSHGGSAWAQFLWLAVIIAWLLTMTIGRIDKDAIGDLVGLIIGILTSIIFVAVISSSDLSVGLLNWICISFTGGTAYAVAISTINDRNVQGAGIGAASSAVLASIILAFIIGHGFAALFIFLTVVGAMAVSVGVNGGLQENLDNNRISKRGIFALLMFMLSLIVLVRALLI